MVSFNLSGMCTQALIYFWVAVIVNAVIYFRTFNNYHLIGAVIIVPLWTYVVNKMCKNGYTVLAWVFGILPIATVLFNFAIGVLSGISAGVKGAVSGAAYEGFDAKVPDAVKDAVANLNGEKKEEKKPEAFTQLFAR